MTPEQPDKLEVVQKARGEKAKWEAGESGPQGVCAAPAPPTPGLAPSLPDRTKET